MLKLAGGSLFDIVGLEAANAPERTADPCWISRVVNSGRIGEKFPLSTDCRLNQACRQGTECADRHQNKSRHDHADTDRRPGVILAAAPGVKQYRSDESEGDVANEADRHDSKDEACQTDVQFHVAMHDVTELVRDDTL